MAAFQLSPRDESESVAGLRKGGWMVASGWEVDAGEWAVAGGVPAEAGMLGTAAAAVVRPQKACS